MEKAYFYDTTIGRIRIAEDGKGITEVSLITGQGDLIGTEQFPGYELCETALIKEAAKQLTEYLQGSRKEFTLKLNPKGTEFQRKVWEALCKIPYGQTRSYKQIAEAVGNSKASRAVGMANHYNPILCIVPCHRVIGASGKMVGYAAGLDLKEKLLNMEKEIDKSTKTSI